MKVDLGSVIGTKFLTLADVASVSDLKTWFYAITASKEPSTNTADEKLCITKSEDNPFTATADEKLDIAKSDMYQTFVH